MNNLRCDGCAAYQPDGLIGHCHHFPPENVRDVRNDLWTPFPQVAPDWWCRQHEPAEDAPAPPVGFSPPAAQILTVCPAPEDDF